MCLASDNAAFGGLVYWSSRNRTLAARTWCATPRRATALWAVLLLLVISTSLAVGQQVPRVGILSPYLTSDSFQDEVKRGLMEIGYAEGRTIAYETRFAEGHTERLPTLVTDLVRGKVDVIVTTTAPAVRAAMQATSTIPIVVAGVDDAVEQGFVASLAKPGGNVTGTSWLNAELTQKRLDLLAQAVLGLGRVAILREAVGAGTTARAVMTAAQKLGLQAFILEVRAINELEPAFIEMTRIHVGALSVVESPMMTAEDSWIASLALKHGIPSIFPTRRFLQAGGLMSYGPSLSRTYRQAASYVDRIIKGAKPAERPVEQPTQFTLVVNQRTARLLGLSLPEAILLRADEIIE